MECTLVSGATVELPPMTMALNEMTERIAASQGSEHFRVLFDFISAVIPADLLEEEVGGTAVATANLISLEVTYTRILNAYLRPVIAERMTAINEQMGSIKPVAEALGTINAAASANAVNRQHFSRVR